MPRSITLKKDISPILVNQRLTPYKLDSEDQLQLKIYLNSNGQLSRRKDILVELYLNYTGTFINYTSGLTDSNGTCNITFPCYNIQDIGTCVGYVAATVDGISYNSNLVRFNFVQTVSHAQDIVLYLGEIMTYSNDLINYEE